MTGKIRATSFVVVCAALGVFATGFSWQWPFGTSKQAQKAAVQGKFPNEWAFSRDGTQVFPLLDFTLPEREGEPKRTDEQLERQVQKLSEQLTNAADGKKWSRARLVLDKMLKNYAGHPGTAQAFNEYVARLSQEKSKKKEALSACRDLIRRFPNYSWSAYHIIERLTDTRLYFYNYGRTSVEPGQKPTIQLNGRNIRNVAFTIYKVDLFQMLKEGISLLAPSIPKKAELVKSWTHRPKTEHGDWFYENVEIPVTEPGAYLIAMGTVDYRYTTLVLVSRLALATKGDGRILLAYASDVRGGNLPGDCDIAILDNIRPIYRGKTNPEGLFVGRVKGQARNGLIVARRGNDWAVSHAYSYYSSGTHYGQIYTYTDRPVYRPKQTVYMKFVLRRYNFEKEALEFKRGEELNVVIRDPKWNEVLKKTVKTNDFGTAKISMTLGEEPPLGTYQIQVGGPNASGHGRFSVQEYKKPEYEVEVSFDGEHAIIGEKVKISVGARYYFGEPVKDAGVSYEIYANRRYRYPWWRGGRRYHWFAEDYYPGRHTVRGEMVARGKGRLNQEGKFEITFDTSKVSREKGYDYDLSVRASVTDKSRRQIQGYGTIHLARAGIELSIHADRYSYRPGEKMVVNVLTTDLDGRGISAAVKFNVSRQDKNGEYKPRLTKTIKTNKSGHGTFSMDPDKSGYFRIDASAKDRAGRKVLQTIHVWVAGENWRSPYRYSGIELKTDRNLYKPGEKAQVLITTGYVDHPVLVTVEADRIERYRLSKFNGSLLSFDLPIEKSFSPTASLAAMVFAEGSFVNRQQTLVVPPVEKWLNVKIKTDKPEYKPGQKAVYTLSLTDYKGKPVIGELSFGLVDEAIYAIEPESVPDIRKFYYGTRRRYIQTQTSFWFRSMGLGGKDAKRKAASAPAGAESPSESRERAPLSKTALRRESKKDKKALVKPRVRKDFADSAVWKPMLRTRRNGKAVVSFKMPDNLTTWRAKVVAITQSGLVGQETHKIITRKNLMVRLECPRTFTERDKVTISAVVHNYLLKKKHCVVSLKNDRGELIDSRRKVEIALPSGADKRADWILEVSTHKPIKLTVSALTDEESDAMQLTIPVIPHGIKLIEAESGSVHEKARIVLVLPPEADGDRSLLFVSLSPSLAATMTESLEYLAGYPYGCVEQTMSRFLPTVIVAQVLRKLGMKNAKLEEKLPDYVEKGLKRLYDFQHGDGGWGWWKNGKSDNYMTAYVIYGLTKAREADFGVRSDAIDRGIKFLAGAIPSEKDPDTKAYMTFSYSQVRTPKNRWVENLYRRREKLSDYATALLLLTYKKMREPKRINQLVESLEARASQTRTTCYWGGGGNHYHWQRNQIQATSYALKALVQVNPRHPLLGKTVRWLVVQRQGNYWYSTKDTAAAIFALAEYMKATGELNPDYKVSLYLNGKLVKSSHFEGNALNLKPLVIEFTPKHIRRGKNVLKLRKEGRGNLYYSASLEYYTKGEDIKPSSAGISLKREYFLLIPKEEGKRITFERRPLGREVESGQEIEVRLEVLADKSYRYFMLEDFLPSGCEVVTDKSDIDRKYRHWWRYCSMREARDEKMVFFSSNLRAGKHTFVYTLRAETPGEFHVMPAQASLMYQPDVRGTSAENRFSIIEQR